MFLAAKFWSLCLHLSLFHWCVCMADNLYQQSVNVLAMVREDWLKEHVHTCEVRLWERSPKKTASETTGDASELNTSVTFFFPPPTGVWSTGERANKLPEKHGVDSPQPAVPAVCDQRRGEAPQNFTTQLASMRLFLVVAELLSCTFFRSCTRRSGSRWSCVMSRKT